MRNQSDHTLILKVKRRESLIDDDDNNDEWSKMLYYAKYVGYKNDKTTEMIVRFWRVYLSKKIVLSKNIQIRTITQSVQ